MTYRFTHILAAGLGAMAFLSIAGVAQAGSDEEKMAEIKENGGCPKCDLRTDRIPVF